MLILGSTAIQTLSFDHISPRLADIAQPSAVFYFDPASSTAPELLAYLDKHASADRYFRYIVRYKPSSRGTDRQAGRKTAMSGYGVELALKRTDYLVVDDRATSGSSAGLAQEPLSSAGELGSAEGPFATILGADPWLELSTPLRPTELASELSGVL